MQKMALIEKILSDNNNMRAIALFFVVAGFPLAYLYRWTIVKISDWYFLKKK